MDINGKIRVWTEGTLVHASLQIATPTGPVGLQASASLDVVRSALRRARQIAEPLLSVLAQKFAQRLAVAKLKRIAPPGIVAQAARQELATRGVDVSGIRVFSRIKRGVRNTARKMIRTVRRNPAKLAALAALAAGGAPAALTAVAAIKAAKRRKRRPAPQGAQQMPPEMMTEAEAPEQEAAPSEPADYEGPEASDEGGADEAEEVAGIAFLAPLAMAAANKLGPKVAKFAVKNGPKIAKAAKLVKAAKSGNQAARKRVATIAKLAKAGNPAGVQAATVIKVTQAMQKKLPEAKAEQRQRAAVAPAPARVRPAPTRRSFSNVPVSRRPTGWSLGECGGCPCL